MHSWQIPPPTRAVTIGGILGAIGVDSQTLLLMLGLELGAGVSVVWCLQSRLGLEVGVRVNPHIGGVDINEGTGSILL